MLFYVIRTKNLPIIFYIFLLVSVYGCEKNNEIKQPSPKEVITSYLNASLHNRSDEAYGYISSDDKAVKSLAEHNAENAKVESQFARIVQNSTSFKVQHISITGETARANVDITLPDMSLIFKEFMGIAFASAFVKQDENEIEKKIMHKYESTGLPTTIKSEEFILTKEKTGWKVFLDWRTRKIQKEKEEKISLLMSEAKKLRKSKELNGAIEKYEEVLSLNSEIVEAKSAINETKSEIRDANEKREYLDNVILYDLKSGYYDTYLENKVAGVEFKIENKGSMTLSKVEVTVYFKNSKEKIIHEEKYYPVLVSKNEFSRNNKPLKPGYIWQMERSKFYKADSVPSEWKEGMVAANVTNIEFSK